MRRILPLSIAPSLLVSTTHYDWKRSRHCCSKVIIRTVVVALLMTFSGLSYILVPKNHFRTIVRPLGRHNTHIDPIHGRCYSNSPRILLNMTTKNTRSTHHHSTHRIVRSSLIGPELERHQRHIPASSTSSFLLTSLLLPVWSVTVLPFTILYQVGKRIVTPLLITKGSLQQNQLLLDSGYVIDPKQNPIVPRSERKYDIIVLGATGFTGKLAVRHLVEKYYENPGQQVHWAIAGRDDMKLRQTLVDLANELNMDSQKLLNAIDRIIVDTSIPSTMPKLVEQTKCVASTVGPYTLYGNHVVEFCAKFGTHYVDITGEVDWIRLMIHQWQTTAYATGSILVPFCGHE
jgi:Saccharopine dehydrogenase NADP binding domain